MDVTREAVCARGVRITGMILLSLLGLSACGGGGGEEGNGGATPTPIPSILVTPTPAVTPTPGPATPTPTPTATPTPTIIPVTGTPSIPPSATPTTTPTPTATPTPTSIPATPVPIPQPDVVRGAVLNFIATQQDGQVTGNRTEPVTSLEGARFTVTVLSRPDEDGNFGDEIDITDSVRVGGDGLGPGEFEIDADQALATLNGDPRLSLLSFISSQIALNVALDAPTSSDPLPAALMIKHGAKALFPFASTLIDTRGGSSGDPLIVSRASDFVTRRLQARIRTVQISGGTAGVEDFLNRISPPDLQAPRVELETQIAATPVVFNNDDPAVFADQLAGNGLVAGVDADLDTVTAVSDSTTVSSVVGRYNLLTYEVELGAAYRNGPSVRGEFGTLSFATVVELTEDVAGTGLLATFNEAYDAIQNQNTSGTGYFRFYEIRRDAEGGGETETVSAAIAADDTLSFLIDQSAEERIRFDNNLVLRLEGGSTLKSPPSPTALRAINFQAVDQEFCQQDRCNDTAGREAAGRGDLLAETAYSGFGWLAPVLDTPVNVADLDDLYGFVGFSVAFDPAEDRQLQSVSGLASLEDGAAEIGTATIHQIVRRPPISGLVELTVDEVGHNALQVRFETSDRTPVLGDGQIAVRFTEVGEVDTLMLGFFTDAERNSFVVSEAFTCQINGASPQLCPEGQYTETTNPTRPVEPYAHLTMMGVRLPTSLPASSAELLTQMAGRYRLQGFLINHYSYEETAHSRFVEDSILSISADGQVTARLRIEEINIGSDQPRDGVEVRTNQDIFELYANSVALNPDNGEIQIRLTDTLPGEDFVPGVNLALTLTGYFSADGVTLAMSSRIEKGANAGALDEAGLGFVLAHRLP